MNQLRIQPAAAAEPEEAADWYEDQQAGLGIEFILELDSAIERAATRPEAYAVQYRGARRVLVGRFPYSVYFLFEDEIIEIFAVLHQHRDPTSWQARLQ